MVVSVRNSNYSNIAKAHNIPKIPKHRPNIVPGCRCNSPLSIVLREGQHIHPCQVHTDFVIYGKNRIIC